MGTSRVLIVCLLLFAASSAQQSQNNQFNVEGVVVNSVTGKALPRVLVQLNARSVLTGPEGEFSFDGVPADAVFIRLTKPGYFVPGNGPFAGTMGNGIKVGPDVGKVVLKLAPEAVITGQVAGQDGEPLEGADIQVLAFTSVEGRQLLVAARGAVRTDEDGNFRAAGLRAGRYYLAVKAGDVYRRILGVRTPKVPEAYPAVVYYPASTDLAAANAFDLAPGQKMEVQFSLSLAPAYKLAGKVVVAGDWSQVHAPMIMDALDQHLFGPDQFDAQSGTFEFRAIPAGTYTIRISGMDQQNRQGFSTHKITVSKNVTDLKVLLQPGADIPVVVRNEFSAPRPRGVCSWNHPGGQVEQSDCSDYPAARVELISMESMRLRFSTEYRPMKDPSSYAVLGVPPGKYMARTQSNIGGYVQSVRSGTVDLLREELTVPEEGPVAPIEVVLRDDPGALKVLLRAAKPGQGAAILALRDGVLFTPPNLTWMSSAEAYLAPMTPGNYKVFAFESVDGLDYNNPEVLAKYASQAASVTVTANGNSSVIVDVIHKGE